MAGVKRPSFLKRQKEQQRRARAAEKLEARRARKQAKAAAAVAHTQAAIDEALVGVEAVPAAALEEEEAE